MVANLVDGATGLHLDRLVWRSTRGRIGRQDRSSILNEAVHALSRIFKIENRTILRSAVAGHTHDWMNDPFSGGAYSYTPVGAVDMPNGLAKPLAGTLFFAGEATDSDGDQGTVHGALRSGYEAARAVLATLHRRPNRATKPHCSSKNNRRARNTAGPVIPSPLNQ